jgi:uncharacterized protein YjbJ (UPF0337 family)
MQEFAKTGKAANASGTYNETAGYFKRKLGEMTDDSKLKEAGRNQQLLGKIHNLVGSLREAREAAVEKFNTTRNESKAICRKHGGKLLDIVSEFVDDMKKTLFK